MGGLHSLIKEPARCTSVVVGSGKSGFAALKFLHRLGSKVFLSESGRKETVSDTVLSWLAQKNVGFETGEHSEKVFLDADLIVVSPGVPLDIKVLRSARKAGKEIIGEFGLAAAFIDIPMVAVTGTNGKTTVTELIGELFKAAEKKVFVGGNIGTPLTDYLLEKNQAEVAVVEVSSYQLDTAGDFDPKVAVLLNISPDHLDRYPSYEGYAASKMKIFSRQKKGDAVIVNGDDTFLMEQLAQNKSRAERFFFARDNDKAGARIEGGEIVLTQISTGDERYTIPQSLQFSPNRENAMAAVLAARLAGCPQGAIAKGLLSFKPLEHRLTKVAEIDGVEYFDDSKATNIGAVESALMGMDKPVILIAGGRDKGGDYRLLAKQIRSKVKKMVLIGEAKEKIARALADEASIEMAESLDEAVRKASHAAHSGDVVLLSPACASFDMFNSYAERGELFQQAVKQLQDKEL